MSSAFIALGGGGGGGAGAGASACSFGGSGGWPPFIQRASAIKATTATTTSGMIFLRVPESSSSSASASTIRSGACEAASAFSAAVTSVAS